MKLLSSLPLVLALSVAPVQESQASANLVDQYTSEVNSIIECGDGPYPPGGECDFAHALINSKNFPSEKVSPSGKEDQNCFKNISGIDCFPKEKKILDKQKTDKK